MNPIDAIDSIGLPRWYFYIACGYTAFWALFGLYVWATGALKASGD